MSEREIFDRDVAWLKDSHCIVAEVTTPSLGVGYELGLAHALGTPVLCLFRPSSGRSLSAMVQGCPDFVVRNYGELDEARAEVDAFLRSAQVVARLGGGASQSTA